MKKIMLFLAIVGMLVSCAPSSAPNGGEVVGVSSTAFGEPTPYGMVLVKRGSFEIGPSEKDTLWGTPQTAKGISIDAFWMDETEITNSCIGCGIRLFGNVWPIRLLAGTKHLR